MSVPRLELRDVGLSYVTRQGETRALAGISLRVEPGEFVSIVGPSGCGKSTILSLFAGLLGPTTGQVLVGGRPVVGPSRRIGYMLQRDTLLEWRTIRDNCLLGVEVHGLDRPAAGQRVDSLLAQTGLAAFAQAYPEQLSGGMRQRAALVRTLAIQPDILLLDEPFSALDFQTRLRLQQELRALLGSTGQTALLVTHDIGEAIGLSDRVLVLTPRPARVAGEHLIRFGTGPRPSPLAAQERPEFAGYFRHIWEELASHEAGA